MNSQLLNKRWAAVNKRWAAVLAVLAMAVVGFLALAVWAAVSNVIVVENLSGQTIARLTITITGENVYFDSIGPGETVSSTFRIRNDDQFVVDGRLADGTVFKGKDGYVTSGMFGQQATFQVQPNGSIVFTQS